MATDYRFAIRCWQDQAGDENAKANIFINGTQVVTEQEITATSVDSPQIVNFEVSGLSDNNPDGSVTCDIKVVLVNNYYVDSNTDRNIWINGIAHVAKDDGIYKGQLNSPLTNFSNWDEYNNPYFLPTAVTGDEIPDGFWDNAISDNGFYYTPVYGGDNGVTMTWRLT